MKFLLAAIAGFVVTAANLSAEPVRIKPSSADLKFNQAVALLGEGNLKEADVLFQQILADDPAQLHAALGRARVAIAKQRVTDADRAIEAVLATRPDMPEAHNMKGVVLLLQNRSKEAHAEFTRAIQLHPKYVTPRVHLAAMARADGDLPATIAAYKSLIDLAPRLSVGYIGVAEAMMMQRDNTGAYAVLNAWKSADPGSVLPYHVLANVYYAEKNSKKAVDELNAALLKHPGHVATLVAIGDLQVAIGNWNEAVGRYEAALALDKTDSTAALRLGDGWLKQGQTHNAIAAYRRALAIDPGNPVASNNLAWLLSEAGKDQAEALKLAQDAIKADPTYVDAFDTLGWIHYRRGEFADAITILRKAKSLAGERPDISAHLGLALAKIGDRGALAELRFALSKGGPGLPNRAEVEQVAAALAKNQR